MAIASTNRKHLIFMMSDKSGMPVGRIVKGLLFIVLLGFMFPLISPWNILTLTQVIGFALAICLEVTFCIAAYKNYGLLTAVAAAALTNTLVVIGWTGFRVIVTEFLAKPSSQESPKRDGIN